MCKERPDQNFLTVQKPASFFFFLALFILIAATWRAGGPEFRFRTDEVLTNPLTTSQYPPVWEVRGPFGNFDIGPDSITLKRKSDGDCAVLVPVNIAGFATGTVLRARADLIIKGEKDSNRRTHYLHFYAMFYRDGDLNGIESLRQGMPEHRHKPVYRVFRIPAKSDGMNLVLQCGQAQDRYRLDNLRLERVEYSSAYKVAMVTLLALWGLVLLSAVHWLVRRVSWRVYLPLVLGVGALAVGIAASKPYFVQLLDPLHTLVVAWIPVLRLPSLNDWFKIGHMVFFFAIAVVLFFNHRRLRVSSPWVFVALVMLAFATEAWQMHFLGRWSRLSDVVIDVTGVIFALVLVALWDFTVRKWASVTQR